MRRSPIWIWEVQAWREGCSPWAAWSWWRANRALIRKSEAETHWLDQCDDDAACGGALCVCGVCTVECAADDLCVDDARPACANARQMAAVCGRPIAACVRACAVAADCGAGDFECRAGTCAAIDAPPGDLPDAAAPDAAVPDAAVPDAAPPPDAASPEDAGALPIDRGPIDAAPAESNLSAGGPYRGQEGGPYGVFGTADIEMVEWRWDLGDDGEIDAVGQQGVITPPEQGLHPLVLIAEDVDGGLHITRTTFDVADVDAGPDWYPPSAVWIDEPATLPPARCAANPHDPVQVVEVDLGDGFRLADGPLEHTWRVAGRTEVVLRCTDEDSSRDWPFPIDVRVHDRDGDGVEDALDACPDHPPPYTCDGPCAGGFSLSDLPDPVAAARADQETNARIATMIEGLFIPENLRAELLDLIALGVGVDCDGPDDPGCTSDGDDLDLALRLFDVLARQDLPVAERRCVDAALDFRLADTERRVRFICGEFSFASGGMQVLRRLHPWLGDDLVGSRCLRQYLYNQCLVPALDQINAPRAAPAECPEPPWFIRNNDFYEVEVGTPTLLPLQCDDHPDVRWRLDWGDGSPPELGSGPALHMRHWLERGRFIVELSCRRGTSVSGRRIEIVVQ